MYFLRKERTDGGKSEAVKERWIERQRERE